MRHPEGPVPAIYFDGESASRHSVTVTVHWHQPAALIIDGEAPGLPLRWPLHRLRALSDQADNDRLVITQVADSDDETARDPVRIVIEDPGLRDWIRRSRPDLFRKDLRDGTGLKIATRVLGALAAFLVILFVLLPSLADTLARLIPPEREAAFGRATVRQFELMFGGNNDSLRCENPEAQRIWDDLAARLVAGSGYDAPITIIVMDHPMVNAFAAPGGHIVFFQGMIDAAEGPDEITAVLAHEIGHVVARDPTRLALRSVGSVGLLGLVLGDFAGGGLVLALTEQLIDSSYSREAETGADAFAFEAMVRENVDPAALGDLFERLKERYGDIEGIAAHFLSHPSLSDRIATAHDAGAWLENPEPALDAADYRIIRSTCE